MSGTDAETDRLNGIIEGLCSMMEDAGMLKYMVVTAGWTEKSGMLFYPPAATPAEHTFANYMCNEWDYGKAPR